MGDVGEAVVVPRCGSLDRHVRPICPPSVSLCGDCFIYKEKQCVQAHHRHKRSNACMSNLSRRIAPLGTVDSISHGRLYLDHYHTHTMDVEMALATQKQFSTYSV